MQTPLRRGLFFWARCRLFLEEILEVVGFAFLPCAFARFPLRIGLRAARCAEVGRGLVSSILAVRGNEALDLRRIAAALHQVPGDQPGKTDDDAYHDDLNDHEGYRTPIDLAGGDRRRRLACQLVEVLLAGRHAAQVEQREPERGMHERGLHVHTEQHAEPDQIDAELVRDRSEQRHDDERQLEEIEEEREQEGQHVHDDEESDLPAREAGEQVLDPKIAAAYMSPTDRPSWSASTMRTSDGGMICASVPEAAITPLARRRS